MLNLFNNTEATSEQTRNLKDIRPLWKARAAAREITRADIAALCVYRALIKGEVPDGAKSRLHKSFSPITNQVKLANGAKPYGSMEYALYAIKYSCFADWLDPDQLKQLMNAAKTTKEAGLE